MKRGLIFVIFVLAFLPTVSAEILMNQPEGGYNIGDELKVDVTLKPSLAVNDFLIVKLTCGNRSTEIYRNSFSLLAGNEKRINIANILDRTIVSDLRGVCGLNARYGTDEINSQSFKISDVIDVDLDLRSARFDPGQKIVFSGSALKANGDVVNGFIEVTIETLGLIVSNSIGGVEDFTFNFTFPEDSPAGEHIMIVRVYERDSSGETSNSGNVTESISVNQILKKLEISVSSQTITPGETLTYSVRPLDQSGVIIESKITVTIFEPGDFEFSQEVVGNGESVDLKIELSNVPGYWKVEASSRDKVARKLFYVEEHVEIFTSLIGDTLIVSNIGNVPYIAPIEIAIGSEIEIRQLNLNVGEVKKYRLYAPDGNYLITVNSGDDDVALGNTFLTGRAIGVGEIREGLIGSVSSPIFWVVSVFLLILIVLYVAIKVRKKSTEINKKDSKMDSSVIKGSSIVDKFKRSKVEKEQFPMSSGGGSQVNEGIKEEASVIAVKLNSRANSPSAVSYVNNALGIAKRAGSNVYIDGAYRIILLSPLLTKSKENDIMAVKLASKIEAMFTEHNRKYKEKINFGIGVNSGTIISERKGFDFRFASLGGIISKTKKIAGLSDGEVLVSDVLRKRIITKVKTEKVKGKDAWKIVKITDRSNQHEFLERFKKKG